MTERRRQKGTRRLENRTVNWCILWSYAINGATPNETGHALQCSLEHFRHLLHLTLYSINLLWNHLALVHAAPRCLLQFLAKLHQIGELFRTDELQLLQPLFKHVLQGVRVMEVLLDLLVRHLLLGLARTNHRLGLAKKHRHDSPAIIVSRIIKVWLTSKSCTHTLENPKMNM